MIGGFGFATSVSLVLGRLLNGGVAGTSSAFRLFGDLPIANTSMPSDLMTASDVCSSSCIEDDVGSLVAACFVDVAVAVMVLEEDNVEVAEDARFEERMVGTVPVTVDVDKSELDKGTEGKLMCVDACVEDKVALEETKGEGTDVDVCVEDKVAGTFEVDTEGVLDNGTEGKLLVEFERVRMAEFVANELSNGFFWFAILRCSGEITKMPLATENCSPRNPMVSFLFSLYLATNLKRPTQALSVPLKPIKFATS